MNKAQEFAKRVAINTALKHARAEYSAHYRKCSHCLMKRVHCEEGLRLRNRETELMNLSRESNSSICQGSGR